ncbi:MAG: TolC family protein [Paludibacteraceae bacterium]|nr:TolC family protein [Paludibacteraceae bacterium]
MKRITVLLSMVVLSLAVLAQQDNVLSLSLDEAREMALKQNRTLQNASYEVQKAHAQRWQSIAAMLPQVDLNLTYTSMCGYEMKISGMSIPMNPNGTMGLQTSVAINGQMVVATLLNNIAIDMQNINRRNAELDLVVDVETMYLTILAMEKTTNLLDSCVMNLRQLYKLTTAAVEVGAAEQTDADQIEVQVAQMENTLSNQRRALEVAYNSLAFTVGAGSHCRLTLTDKLEDVLTVDEAVALLKHDFNVRENYSYQLAEKNVELAKKNEVLAGMAYVPTLSAYHQYSAKSYFGKDEGMNMTPPNTIGVTLAVPIWSSGKRAAGVHEKKIARLEAENELADAKDQLEISYNQLKYNLITAYENFETQSKSVEVMKRVMASTANKYQYGTASSFDLTNASTNLLNAHTNYIQAILTLLNSQKALKQLLEL